VVKDVRRKFSIATIKPFSNQLEHFMKFTVVPSNNLSGHIKVAGDKSVSHRSIIFGSIATGTTIVNGILEGEDVLATISAFRQMGVVIEKSEGMGCYVIQGKGLKGLTAPSTDLDMGNSGTAFRLLSGLLCAQPWETRLTGDESLNKRPMGRIIDPLSLMGADIESNEGKPPLTIRPTKKLSSICYTTPMASAQVKSAVLLAGLYIDGETTVIENAVTRDHTERMLEGFGYDVRTTVQGKTKTISIHGGGELQGQQMDIPADLSSAAFFIVAGLISSNSEILLEKVGMNPSRNGVIPVLMRMGADISLENQRTVGGEPVADIRVKSSKLKGCEISAADVALAVDEIPVIAVAAACADGVTSITGAEELRVKESDRIRSVVLGLQALGINVDEKPDGMIIEGGEFTAGIVDSFTDHRISMAFTMAGIVAKGPVEVLGCENVATSFPEFSKLAEKVGIDIQTFLD
jgi:3-phosphoshikimate 1-carboxyvinyltransferase